MKFKKVLRGLILTSLVSINVFARELRTPWALQRGYQHAYIPRPKDNDFCWNFDTWLGAEHREAYKAFIDKNSAQTEGSLAGLIFGKPCFKGIEAFAPDVISFANPFLSVANICPKISYHENSAWFGLTVERAVGCERRWRVGARAILPFRVIETELENCCDIEETLQDFCRQENDRVDGQSVNMTATPNRVQDCYAYRLDFLSALYLSQAGVQPLEPLVKYSPGNIRINETDITSANAASTPMGAPVYVTQRDDGIVPNSPYCLGQATLNALPVLNADGSSLANNARAQFGNGVDYSSLGADTTQQGQLWVAPGVGANMMSNVLEMQGPARAIGDAINQIVRNIGDVTALDFFKQNGVDLGSVNLVGCGMLNTEIYANYEFCKGFGEGFIGVRWPTGIRQDNPNKVLKIFTTGNNHHYEIRLGTTWSWNPNCWFALKLDGLYSHAFKARERVAAAFEGAQIKNIGPAVNSDISWNYLFGHANFNFFNPCNPRTGIMFGYEWYTKFKDKVRFDQTTATDFLGNTRSLDPNVLEFRTDVVSHKGMVELFHQGEFWELFAGWTSVFAGKNAPKETDWYIGLVTYF